jgi:hypothetical protein
LIFASACHRHCGRFHTMQGPHSYAAQSSIQSEHRLGQAYVLTQAVGRIFENLDFEYYHLRDSKYGDIRKYYPKPDVDVEPR